MPKNKKESPCGPQGDSQSAGHMLLTRPYGSGKKLQKTHANGMGEGSIVDLPVQEHGDRNQNRNEHCKSEAETAAIALFIHDSGVSEGCRTEDECLKDDEQSDDQLFELFHWITTFFFILTQKVLF